ncbi:MAG: hypothetical protein K0R24_148 [Gammaproteobacteria bacterium]|nr:hypothetical protein [Gammaproteobacteria bacterium]
MCLLLCSCLSINAFAGRDRYARSRYYSPARLINCIAETDCIFYPYDYEKAVMKPLTQGQYSCRITSNSNNVVLHIESLRDLVHFNLEANKTLEKNVILFDRYDYQFTFSATKPDFTERVQEVNTEITVNCKRVPWL